MNATRPSRDAGFTLIEIMVVVVILGLLATIVVPSLLQNTEEARLTKAKTDVTAIRNAAIQYKIRHHKVPTMEDLTTPDEKGNVILPDLSQDPWDNDYQIRETDRGDKFEVLSYGPDKQEGTGDDIISGQLNKKEQ